MKLNHALILASNVNEMSQFFEKIMGLKRGQRPAFKFEGAWLYDETNTACVHIVSIKEVNGNQAKYLSHEPKPESRSQRQIVDHLAFTSNSYRTFILRLVNTHVTYVERDIPESDERQIFITGPDELKIEVLFNRNDLQT